MVMTASALEDRYLRGMEINEYVLELRALLWLQVSTVHVKASNLGVHRHLRLRGRSPRDRAALEQRVSALRDGASATAICRNGLGAAIQLLTKANTLVDAAAANGGDWPARFIASGAARLAERLVVLPWMDLHVAVKPLLHRLLVATSKLNTALHAWVDVCARAEARLEAHFDSGWDEWDCQLDSAAAMVVALLDGDMTWPIQAAGAEVLVVGALARPLRSMHAMITCCVAVSVQAGTHADKRCVANAKVSRLAAALSVLRAKAVDDEVTELVEVDEKGKVVGGPLDRLCCDVEGWAATPSSGSPGDCQVEAAVDVALAQPTALGDLDVAGRLGAGHALLDMVMCEEGNADRALATAAGGLPPRALPVSAVPVWYATVEALLRRFRPPGLTSSEAVSRAQQDVTARDALTALLQLHLVTAGGENGVSGACTAGQLGFAALAAPMLGCWAESLGLGQGRAGVSAQVPVWVSLCLQLLVHVGEAQVPLINHPAQLLKGVSGSLKGSMKHHLQRLNLACRPCGWIMQHEQLALLRTVVGHVLPALRSTEAGQAFQGGVGAATAAVGVAQVSWAAVMPWMLELLAIITRNARVAAQVFCIEGAAHALLNLPPACYGPAGAALLAPPLQRALLHIVEAKPQVQRVSMNTRVRVAFAGAACAALDRKTAAVALRGARLTVSADWVLVDDVLSCFRADFHRDSRLATRAVLAELEDSVLETQAEGGTGLSVWCRLKPASALRQLAAQPAGREASGANNGDDGGGDSSGGDGEDEDEDGRSEEVQTAALNDTTLTAISALRRAVRAGHSWWDTDVADAPRTDKGKGASNDTAALSPPQGVRPALPQAGPGRDRRDGSLSHAQGSQSVSTVDPGCAAPRPAPAALSAQVAKLLTAASALTHLVETNPFVGHAVLELDLKAEVVKFERGYRGDPDRLLTSLLLRRMMSTAAPTAAAALPRHLRVALMRGLERLVKAITGAFDQQMEWACRRGMLEGWLPELSSALPLLPALGAPPRTATFSSCSPSTSHHGALSAASSCNPFASPAVNPCITRAPSAGCEGPAALAADGAAESAQSSSSDDGGSNRFPHAGQAGPHVSHRTKRPAAISSRGQEGEGQREHASSGQAPSHPRHCGPAWWTPEHPDPYCEPDSD